MCESSSTARQSFANIVKHVYIGGAPGVALVKERYASSTVMLVPATLIALSEDYPPMSTMLA